MKILAIRGRDLASLGGAFELDLERDPLAYAGLFVITGPTGAGKSTLLDAMCLALFDRTPRVQGKSGLKPRRVDETEDNALGLADPRNLMRRGTINSHAEVDFSGRDERSYRALWRVHRSRSGKLQNQELSLTDLATGRIVAGKKTEVLAAIEDKLGLNYEQFCRSVLLAQGEFAAFLRADGRERGALLERMTGAEIYSLLSMRAHAKRGELERELAIIKRDVEQCVVLTASERNDREQILREESERRIRLAHDREAANQSIQWHHTFASLKSRSIAAREQLSLAEQNYGSLAHVVTELAQVDRTWPLRIISDNAHQASATLTTANDELKRATDLLEQAEGRYSLSQVALANHTEAMKRSTEARDAMAPVLRRAEALDVEIATFVTQRRTIERDTSDAVSREKKAKKLFASIDAAHHQALEAHNEKLRVVAATPSHKSLHAVWPTVRPSLIRYIEMANADAEKLATEHALTRESDVAERIAEKARLSLASAESTAEIARASLRNSIRPAPWESLHLARKELTTRTGQLERLKVIATQEAALQTQRGDSEHRKSDAQSEIVSVLEQQRIARKSLEIATIRVDEARTSLARAQRHADLAQHRSQLREGEPCPLCGSLEHPSAASELTDALLADLATRVSEVERDLSGFAAADRTATHRLEALHNVVNSSEQERVRVDQMLDAIQLQWTQQASELKETPQRPDEQWIERGLGSVHLALAALDQEELAARAAEREDARIQAAWDDARNRRDDALVQESAATLSAANARHALSICRQQRFDADINKSRALAEIQPLSSIESQWLNELTANPDEFLHWCDTTTSAYERALHESIALANRVAELSVEQIAAGLAADHARDEVSRVTSQSLALDAQIARVKSDRAEVLIDPSANEVRAALDLAVTVATTAHARSVNEHQSHQIELSQARPRETHARATQRAASEALAQHERELESAMTAASVTRDELAKWSAYDDAWRERTRAKINDSLATLETNRTIERDRQAQLDAHVASGPPTMESHEAHATLARVDEAFHDSAMRAASAQRELLDDDATRSRRSTREQKLATDATAVRVWQDLDELIGSANGAEFRSFAQSLTLDALLLQANEHLRQLAPRYRLSRIPGTDMDLQVIDHDLADEARGVNTLSGGESFLTSLALALALSSLSSRDVRVQSLFIDEGFGTLDPESLEIAISMLDSLQSTGRKVGLISQVPGLAERIGMQVRVDRVSAGRSKVRVIRR